MDIDSDEEDFENKKPISRNLRYNSEEEDVYSGEYQVSLQFKQIILLQMVRLTKNSMQKSLVWLWNLRRDVLLRKRDWRTSRVPATLVHVPLTTFLWKLRHHLPLWIFRRFLTGWRRWRRYWKLELWILRTKRKRLWQLSNCCRWCFPTSNKKSIIGKSQCLSTSSILQATLKASPEISSCIFFTTTLKT